MKIKVNELPLDPSSLGLHEGCLISIAGDDNVYEAVDVQTKNGVTNMELKLFSTPVR